MNIPRSMDSRAYLPQFKISQLGVQISESLRIRVETSDWFVWKTPETKSSSLAVLFALLLIFIPMSVVQVPIVDSPESRREYSELDEDINHPIALTILQLRASSFPLTWELSAGVSS